MFLSPQELQIPNGQGKALSFSAIIYTWKELYQTFSAALVKLETHPDMKHDILDSLIISDNIGFSYIYFTLYEIT